MIDTTWLAITVISAAEELGIQRVQDVGIDLPDLLVAQEGQDVLVDVTAVGVQGRAGNAELAEVAVQQLSHGGGGARVPLFR